MEVDLVGETPEIFELTAAAMSDLRCAAVSPPHSSVRPSANLLLAKFCISPFILLDGDNNNIFQGHSITGHRVLVSPHFWR